MITVTIRKLVPTAPRPSSSSTQSSIDLNSAISVHMYFFFSLSLLTIKITGMGQSSGDKLAGGDHSLVSSISTMCQTLLTAPDAELLKENTTCWLLLAQHWQTKVAATAAAHWHTLVGFSVIIHLETLLVRNLSNSQLFWHSWWL